MQARILAFDTGTANTGWSLLKGSTYPKNHATLQCFGMITTKKSDDTSVRDRIDYIGSEVRKLIKELKPTHIAIEDFTEQGKFVGKTYKEMAWLTEHMRLVGRDTNTPLAIFENGDWKKKSLGIQRATKLQVIHYLSVKLPETKKMLEKAPNHIWDSVGIGYTQWILLSK